MFRRSQSRHVTSIGGFEVLHGSNALPQLREFGTMILQCQIDRFHLFCVGFHLLFQSPNNLITRFQSKTGFFRLMFAILFVLNTRLFLFQFQSL